MVLCLINSGTCFQSMLVLATYAFRILRIPISISSSSPIGAGNKMVPISKSSNTCMFSYCSFFLCLLLKIIHHFSCTSSILEFEALLIGVCFFHLVGQGSLIAKTQMNGHGGLVISFIFRQQFVAFACDCGQNALCMIAEFYQMKISSFHTIIVQFFRAVYCICTCHCTPHCQFCFLVSAVKVCLFLSMLMLSLFLYRLGVEY